MDFYTDEQVELIAPKGKFRVTLLDTFDRESEHLLLGDFDTEEEAQKLAKKRGGPMTITDVYNDQGLNIGQYGTY